MAKFDLRSAAVGFADDLSELLNNTVCTGIRLRPYVSKPQGFALIGYNLSTDDMVSPSGVPLTLGRKPPSAYLGIEARLEPDDTEGQHLMVTKSVVSVCLDAELTRELLYYDYERNKPGDYPEAHLHICASPDGWDDFVEARGLGDKTFQHVHIPVGGRRNRPTLEDTVEFLIREGLADAHDGWETYVEAGRKRFLDSQLRAAIRRNPELAEEELRRLKRI